MENNNLPEVIREFQITAADSKNDFSEKNIKNFRQFYLTFPSDKILSAPRKEFAWSHFRTILPIEEKMSEWKEIITTRKSSLVVGLAQSICSTHHIQQGIEKSQQAVGQISSQTLLQSEKPIAKQAVSQFETKIGQQVVARLVQIPWGQNITKNLRDCNE
ncbi:MAG: hypothetical protein J5U19_06405 [Candidatus Methanoperedens sp.]|nr:hypothetical protein [Candidatus Methanoperedens sp.]